MYMPCSAADHPRALARLPKDRPGELRAGQDEVSHGAPPTDGHHRVGPDHAALENTSKACAASVTVTAKFLNSAGEDMTIFGYHVSTLRKQQGHNDPALWAQRSR